MTILKAACVQMTSGPEIEPNLETAESMIREAAGQGAQLIATPENTCLMRMPPELKLETAPPQDEHPGVGRFAGLADELGIWLLIGSLTIKVAEDKLANRSFLFSDDGALVATYDKIHMFDVDLATGERHREGDLVVPGEKAVVAQTPWGGIGMSICYDSRFAYLFRDLAQAGASILTVPAAYTVPTGKAHWKTLLRARAIETGSFLLAPAQTGEHENGRRTWGHSLIIGPWGVVMAEADDKPGIIMAVLDLDEVAKARSAIPALQHDREYAVEV